MEANFESLDGNLPPGSRVRAEKISNVIDGRQQLVGRCWPAPSSAHPAPSQRRHQILFKGKLETRGFRIPLRLPSYRPNLLTSQMTPALATTKAGLPAFCYVDGHFMRTAQTMIHEWSLMARAEADTGMTPSEAEIILTGFLIPFNQALRTPYPCKLRCLRPIARGKVKACRPREPILRHSWEPLLRHRTLRQQRL